MKKDRIKYRSKGSCDVKRMKWVLDQGSIFTEDIVEFRGDAGVFVLARISVAFNVGEVGLYIVDLHNKNIKPPETVELSPGAVLQRNEEIMNTPYGLL